jgi:predicted nucleic-acid-binding protein
MIGLDTNVIIRLLTDDDSDRRRQAVTFVSNAEEPLLINAIVLSEVAWTLARFYKMKRTEIAAHIEELLDADDVKIEFEHAARRALTAYRNGKAGFPDYYLASVNVDLACSRTVTFDKNAADFEAFALIP